MLLFVCLQKCCTSIMEFPGHLRIQLLLQRHKGYLYSQLWYALVSSLDCHLCLRSTPICFQLKDKRFYECLVLLCSNIMRQIWKASFYFLLACCCSSVVLVLHSNFQLPAGKFTAGVLSLKGNYFPTTISKFVNETNSLVRCGENVSSSVHGAEKVQRKPI